MSSRVFLTSAGASARQSLLAASGVASRRTIAQTASLRLKESSSRTYPTTAIFYCFGSHTSATHHHISNNYTHVKHNNIT